jgi:hypothetical protein
MFNPFILMFALVNQQHYQGNDQAYQQTGSEGKVELKIFSLDQNIARQFS